VNKAKRQSGLDSDAALGTTTDNYDEGEDGEDEDDFGLGKVSRKKSGCSLLC